MLAGTRSATLGCGGHRGQARRRADGSRPLVCLQACCALVTVIEPNLHIRHRHAGGVRGAHRSIKPSAQGNTEAMTKQDAMRFPTGSCVL